MGVRRGRRSRAAGTPRPGPLPVGGGGVRGPTDDVRDLIYGAIFTRGVEDLHRTAVFIGGSELERGEAVLAAASKTFLGTLRVSLMLDSSGANTTAAAAVLAHPAAQARNDADITRVLVELLNFLGRFDEATALAESSSCE